MQRRSCDIVTAQRYRNTVIKFDCWRRSFLSVQNHAPVNNIHDDRSVIYRGAPTATQMVLSSMHIIILGPYFWGPSRLYILLYIVTLTLMYIVKHQLNSYRSIIDLVNIIIWHMQACNYMQRNSTYTGYVREVLISVCVYQAGLGCLTNKGLVTTTTADTSPCACPALCRSCGEKLSSYEGKDFRPKKNPQNCQWAHTHSNPKNNFACREFMWYS